MHSWECNRSQQMHSIYVMSDDWEYLGYILSYNMYSTNKNIDITFFKKYIILSRNI